MKIATNSAKNIKYEHSFLGDGLRYEVAEFISCINSKNSFSFKLTDKDMLFLTQFIQSDYDSIKLD